MACPLPSYADLWDIWTDTGKLYDLLVVGTTGDPAAAGAHRAARLFAASVARDLWPLLADDRSRRAVEATEQHFAGSLPRRDWRRAVRAARDVTGVREPYTAPEYAARVAATLGCNSARIYSLPPSALADAAEAIRRSPRTPKGADYLRPFNSTDLVLCGRLRCLLANPFRPAPAFDPAWRTPPVVAVAAGIQADRAWDRLPVLADALEDAGCDAADLLAHARGPGPHVFGCRVVVACLGERQA